MLKKLGELFVSFARIGVLTIGGGYAMLPMMQNELVERRGWATEEEMMDYYALAQCTPGAIAVNVSTFIGYRLAGVAGGVVATLGLVFPSLVIITVIAAFLGNISECWAMTALPPMEIPMNRLTIRLMTGPLEPTAASAWLPTYLPTTMISAALKISCSTPVAISGRENSRIFFGREPVHISISYRWRMAVDKG